MSADAILRAADIGVTYARPRLLFGPAQRLNALSDISFELRVGEVVALTGRSGSGKSTLARCLAGLQTPTTGEVWFTGGRPTPRVQLVFQDSPMALNPRWTVADLLREPVALCGATEDVEALARGLGLAPETLARRAPEISGGQRQRVALARALAVPGLRVLILDEPFSGLDTETRVEMTARLDAEVQRRHLGIIYISHDLHAIARLASRVLVLDGGRLVYDAPVEEFLRAPRHPAGKALLEAALTVRPRT
jgi:peptide/nickel transport system ATP-binding protein